MSNEHLQTLLDSAAGDLVTADYDSVQDVIALCGSVERLRDASTDEGLKRIPLVLGRAIELINSIVTEGTCDRSAVADTLNKIFSAVQLALRPGSEPEELRLPPGLLQGSVVQAADGSAAETPFFLPDYLDRDIFIEFINDQESVLANLEEQLLSLERSPDAEALANLKRIFHTLKGEAGVFELRHVERLCHATEDLIETQPDSIPVDVLLAAKDWLKDCFDALKFARPVPAFSSDVLGILFQGSEPAAPGMPGDEKGVVPLSADVPRKFELSPFIAPEIFEIFIEEQEHALEKMQSLIMLLSDGPDMEAVAGLKRIFHVLNGGSGVCGLTDVERVCCSVEDAIERDPAALPDETLREINAWLKRTFDALKTSQPLPVFDDSLLGAMVRATSHGAVSGPDMDSVAQLFDDSTFNDFLDEQQSVTAEIEELLLKLEKQPDRATLDELQRIFHTLKSEAGVFGLTDIEKLCHRVEDLLDKKDVTIKIDSLFSVKDFLERSFRALRNHSDLPELQPIMLDMLSMPDTVDEDAADGSITAAVVFNPLKGPVEFKVELPQETAAAAKHDVRSGTAVNLLSADLDLLSDFVSEVKEHIDNIDSRLLSLENNPGDSDLLNAVFRVFHTIKGAAGFLALEEISRLAHITESLLDAARKGERKLRGGSIDVVFEAVDEMKNLVGTIEGAIATNSDSYTSSPTVDRLIDKIKIVLSQRQDSTEAPDFQRTQAPDAAAVATGTPAVSAPIQTDAVEPAEAASSQAIPAASEQPESQAAADFFDESDSEDDAFFEMPHENATHESAVTSPSTVQQTGLKYRTKIKESIKVDAENLDKLIDAIGELVIIEAMIRQDNGLRASASSNLLRTITQMDKITRELQTLGMSLRMIPIKATFQKMARVVRDLAKKGDKKIEFVTQGEDTMLDKSVVDRIGDPLIHLVRNAVDHGIESTHDDRRASGKNPVGQILLTAFHKGGNIYIEIRDDGRGLDRSAILNKAAEKGLIREGNKLSDREIYNLILLPGFSTARKVTDVSGRGVGMGVVKRTIEDLRGNIDIQSEQGVGTTITLRLPLTLAIIDGMLVRIGGERYIIPTLSIVESIRPSAGDITTVANKGEMVAVRDKLIPLLRLADLFHISDATRTVEDSIVIVVEDSGRMTGILVDELLGQQSTVIKSLGALKGLAGISGGSIMTDGSVGIILDIAGIVKLALGEKNIEQHA